MNEKYYAKWCWAFRWFIPSLMIVIIFLGYFSDLDLYEGELTIEKLGIFFIMIVNTIVGYYYMKKQVYIHLYYKLKNKLENRIRDIFHFTHSTQYINDGSYEIKILNESDIINSKFIKNGYGIIKTILHKIKTMEIPRPSKLSVFNSQLKTISIDKILDEYNIVEKMSGRFEILYKKCYKKNYKWYLKKLLKEYDSLGSKDAMKFLLGKFDEIENKFREKEEEKEKKEKRDKEFDIQLCYTWYQKFWFWKENKNCEYEQIIREVPKHICDMYKNIKLKIKGRK